jgi:superfamily II DNA/RNA helicase
VCAEEEKFKICCETLEKYKNDKVIIFCETKLRVDTLYGCLLKEKVKQIEAIHGDKTQQ